MDSAELAATIAKHLCALRRLAAEQFARLLRMPDRRTAGIADVPLKDPGDAQRVARHLQRDMTVGAPGSGRTAAAGRLCIGLFRRIARPVGQRLSTETKQSTKTSEFYAFIVVVLAILIAAAMIKGGDSQGTDEFIARQAWLHVSIVTPGTSSAAGLPRAAAATPTRSTPQAATSTSR